MFFVSQIPRDEMVQSFSTRKKIYMEDEEVYLRSNTVTCVTGALVFLSVEIRYVSSDDGAIFRPVSFSHQKQEFV
jgi:hypothetical protein